MSKDVIEAKPFDCLETLGLTGTQATGEAIIENFYKLFNDQTCLISKRDLFKARDILLKQEIERQMGLSEKRFFRIRARLPQQICTKCSGTGKRFLFEKETVTEDCHTCNASGVVIIACKACIGEGRFHHDLGKSEGEAEVSTDVKCKVCGDTGKVQVMCETCKGAKTITKSRFKPIITSSDRCKECGGYGWLDPNRPKPKQFFHKKFNPVMTENLAEAIKGKGKKASTKKASAKK